MRLPSLRRQSSFYFQAKTAQASVTNNIVFNILRAAINFNDGFGGDILIEGNLIFNTCRESGDHGANLIFVFHYDGFLYYK